jgi:hypothetical protein
MSATTLSAGIVCGRCSTGFGRDRVQVRHGSVNEVRLCQGPVRVPVPLVTSVVDFVPAPVVEAPAAPAPRPEITKGSVWVSRSGSLVRVRKARGGSHLLAAELVGSDEGGVWEYRGGAARVIRELGCLPASAERVALYGHRTGACVFCSHPIDDERSLAAGYGPICAGNFGLPWG